MTATITAPDRVTGAGNGQAVTLSDGTSLSWDELITAFRPRLMSYARSRGIREPEDLVQDVFVAAVERLGAFEGDRAGLRSFMFTITYRRIADEHRRGYRHPETLTPDHSTVPDPGPSVEEVVGLDAEAELAMDAFAVLNSREQRVLEMRLLDEATPAEVAKTLGLSSGNVRVIQARALVKVRHHLRGSHGRRSTISLPALGIPLELFRTLRRRPSRGGVLGEWIEWLKTSPRAAAGSGGAGGDGHNVVDLIVRAGQAGQTMSSLAESAEPTATKIGALITVLALGAGVGGQWMLQEGVPPPVSRPVVEEADPVPPPRATDLPGAGAMSGTDSAAQVPVLVFPPGPDDGDSGEPAASPEAGTPDTDPGRTDPSGAPADNMVEGGVEPGLEEGQTGLIDETFEVVEDTVENTASVVEDTVAVVGEVAQTAVDGVVTPVLEDTVGLVESGTTAPVEEVVVPILGQVEESLDDAGEGLGGLLGLS